MRRLFLLTLLALAAACTTPQPIPDPKPDAGPASAPAPAKPTLPPIPQDLIARSGVEEFQVDGLRVVLKRTPGKPVVDVTLHVLGGVTSATPENVGLENLTFSVAASGGTTATPRDAFTQKLQSMGSSIGGSAGRDASAFSMASIRPYFEPTWTLFAQVLTQPAFDPQQLDLDRTRTIESLLSREDSPDQFLPLFANELFFENHPYRWQAEGTVDNVQRFTRQQLLDHHKATLIRERVTLFVVGDVERPALEALVQKDLAALPHGSWSTPALAEVSHDKPRLATKAKEVATNYIMGYFAAPAPDHPDYFPFLLATSTLSDRLFEEVRTKRNLTYAVSCGLSTRRANVGYLYTTTVKPNDTIPVILQEVDRIQTQPLSPKELDDQIQVFLTEHFLRQETADAQAGSLITYDTSGGGWEHSLVFLDRVKAVTPADIQRVSQAYFKHIQWAYLGKTDALDQTIFSKK